MSGTIYSAQGAKMIGYRLRQLRSARGLSMDELVAKMGGIVTKASISKYELDKTNPSPKVLANIADALHVKTATFFSKSDIKVEFLGYRKRSSLLKSHQTKIESCVIEELEKRVKLQEILGAVVDLNMPIRSVQVNEYEQTELAAENLRKTWKLGLDPISNVMNVLEEHAVHVIELESDKKFDGISALAYSKGQDKPSAIGVVVRKNVVGERQRLDSTHELGHVVLKPAGNIDEEVAAFRFGAAFLAPKESLIREVGKKRTSIPLSELLVLKRRYGLSIQSLIVRLKDLGIISTTYLVEYYKFLSRSGYRKSEPNPLPIESPTWFRQIVLRALSEGIVSHADAEELLQEKLENNRPLTLMRLKQFMKLPLSERRRLLDEQAKIAKSYYEENSEWKSLGEGDFIEH